MPPETPIESLLDATRDALLGGRLDRLADLADALGALAPAHGLGQDALARLQRKAQRNARLLTAATMGVRAARRRAAEISQHGRFSTYNAQGQRDQIGLAPGAPARRL